MIAVWSVGVQGYVNLTVCVVCILSYPGVGVCGGWGDEEIGRWVWPGGRATMRYISLRIGL
jgi:hypothetical protein